MSAHSVTRSAIFRFGCVALLILLAARTASAEVMDKELSLADIAHALTLAILLALPAAALHRWLLLPLFVLGPVQELAYAWTECHDPFVGPSISLEAGPGYAHLADGAMAAAVAAYLGLWVLSSLLRHRRRNPKHDVAFACTLFAAAVLHALLGFSVTWRPFLSLPLLVAGAAVLVTIRRLKKPDLAQLA